MFPSCSAVISIDTSFLTLYYFPHILLRLLQCIVNNILIVSRDIYVADVQCKRPLKAGVLKNAMAPLCQQRAVCHHSLQKAQILSSAGPWSLQTEWHSRSF